MLTDKPAKAKNSLLGGRISTTNNYNSHMLWWSDFVVVCHRGVPRIVHWGLRSKAENGVRFLRRGQQPPPHQLGVLGSAVSSPSGVRPPKGFPLLSPLRMASPHTIILLIVDYHAAIGGKTPCSLAYAPGISSWHRVTTMIFSKRLYHNLFTISHLMTTSYIPVH